MHKLFTGLLVASAMLLASCQSLPDPARIPLTDTPHTIWLIYRDWHTSVLIDGTTFWQRSTLSHADSQLEFELSSARYVRVGWGDGDYFTGKGRGAGTATRALFVSGYSALQIIGYEQEPFTTIPEATRVPLQISEAGLVALMDYIDTSFARGENNELSPLPSYVDNAGVFYAANSRYGLFKNCNTWSGEALQAAGLPIRSAFALTAQSIFEQARYITSVQQQHRP